VTEFEQRWVLTMRVRSKGNGMGFVAFGAGMLLALLCPTKVVLIVIAAAFVLLGLAVLKC